MTERQQKNTVRRYRTGGLSIRDIEKRTGITKYRVEMIVKEIEKTEHQISKTDELLSPYRELIISWLDVKKLTAKLIYKRLLAKKIAISESSALRYLRKLKKPETYVPVQTPPGQEAQVDFGYFGRFKKDGKLVKVWVFNMVLSHSRYAFYKIVTDQTTATFWKCHQQEFEFFGGVPKTVLIDNLGAGVLEADFYQPFIQKRYADFLKYYKSEVLTARICRGQDKGKVEAGVKYVKNNFLKNLEHRDFAQLEKDLLKWNRNTCNLRLHGTIRKIPNEVFISNEKKKLTALPLQRYEIYKWEPRTVNQFGSIYYAYNQYTVPYHYAGEEVMIATNGIVIKIYKDDIEIAMHIINHKRGEFIIEEKHKPVHKRTKNQEHYRQLMEKIGQNAIALMEIMMSEKYFHWKKMCNGIHKLREKYSDQCIDRACRETIQLKHKDYNQVKNICVATFEKNKDKPASLQSTGGYAHDLKKYDRFVTIFKG